MPSIQIPRVGLLCQYFRLDEETGRGYSYSRVVDVTSSDGYYKKDEREVREEQLDSSSIPLKELNIDGSPWTTADVVETEKLSDSSPHDYEVILRNGEIVFVNMKYVIVQGEYAFPLPTNEVIQFDSNMMSDR
ncbi:hypothetical protein Goe19_01140 [Bacillus phage vB_BsuM-Goe19]|nr:hypothetical protein Goe19_01140 [Bacillus phage vB_BsuM-Goe19]